MLLVGARCGLRLAASPCNEPEPLVINELWILLLPGFLS
jgi:hypothetical protein